MKMRAVSLVIGSLALVALSGCLDRDITGPTTHVECDPRLLTFTAAVGDTVTTPQGLRYIDMQVGTGAPTAQGRIVDVNYSGYLAATGAMFDTSCPTNRDVFRLVVGPGGAIEGFWRGVEGMRPGGVRRLIIPPALGYGAGGSPPFIPGNATLIFDVQLVNQF
jgi:FKBP-type peptidyl-prolyl cis-trans isomerase FkpA